MYLVKSPAVNIVKRNMGQNNHFLITCLVGLDLIKNSKEICPPAFSPQWKPNSLEISAIRSREYVLNSSLAWIVDCMEGYFFAINKKPNFVENINLRNQLNGEKISRSVLLKLELFEDYLKLQNDPSLCLAHLAIAWRNRVIHSEASNDITFEHRKVLIDNSDTIEREHSGLIVQDMLKDFDEGSAIKQKAVSSLCKATQDILYEIDRRLMLEIDLDRYTRAILNNYLYSHKKNLHLKWLREGFDKAKFINQIFLTNGFLLDNSSLTTKLTTFQKVPENVVKDFASKSFEELFECVKDFY